MLTDLIPQLHTTALLTRITELEAENAALTAERDELLHLKSYEAVPAPPLNTEQIAVLRPLRLFPDTAEA